MKRKNKSLLAKAFSIISDPDNSLPTVRDRLKTVIGDRADLNAREKAALYSEFIRLYNIHDYSYLEQDDTVKRVMSLMSAVERKSDSRNKKLALKQTLRDNRARSGLPIVFYLCSYHEKPAKGHKDFQSKVYVDRFWKSTIDSKPELHWLVDPIRAYIRNHSVLTVQEVTEGEPYLITRPYCRHRMIPIDTWTILTSSLSAIKRDHPEAVQGTGNKSRRQYWKEYIKTKDGLKTVIKQKTRVKA